MFHSIRASFACAFCLLACLAAEAAPAHPLALLKFERSPVLPVVVFGPDARLTEQQFAERNHLNAADVKRRHAASGVIHCGLARGAGQLTLSNDVITTAAHVFYDEHGELRGDSSHCFFSVTLPDGDATAAIDVSSVVAGAKAPYAEPAVHDWAVARLLRPIIGATPYALGPSAKSSQAIEFVARGHSDWGAGSAMSMQDCQLRDVLSSGSEGTREFAFDCDAGVGASGGAVLTPGEARLLGVFVGYRSVAPNEAMPFSPQHYNFGVTLDGAFRQAVESAASTSAVSAR
jgi:trypsin-like peptidase